MSATLEIRLRETRRAQARLVSLARNLIKWHHYGSLSPFQELPLSPLLLRLLTVMTMRVHLFRRWSWGGRRNRWRVSAHIQSHLLGWQWARVQFPVPSPAEAWEGRGCFSLFWLQCKEKRCWISLRGKEVFQNKVEPLKYGLLWGFYVLCSVKLRQYFQYNIYRLTQA